MASQTQRISPNDWEKHKGTILNLRRHKDYTLKSLRNNMRIHHSFDASISQYEAQFRVWESRKNVSSAEWAAAFNIIDQPDFQRQENRILIFGEQVDIKDHKVQRARRTYKKGKYRNSDRTAQGGLPNLRNISLQVRGIDGSWISYSVSSESARQTQDESHTQPSSQEESIIDGRESSPAVQQESHDRMHADVDVFEIDRAIGSYPDPWNTLDFQEIPEDTVFETFESNFFGVSQLNPSMHPTPQVETSSFIGNNVWSPSWASIPSQNWSRPPSPFLLPLASSLFPTSLSSIVVVSPFQAFLRDVESLSNNTVGRSLSFGGAHSAAIRHSFRRFQEDINSCLVHNTEDLDHQESPNVAHLLSSLGSQLPENGTQRMYNSRESLMSDEEMLQARLMEVLLFSTANGFSGLEGIPIQCVFQCLHRCANIRLLLKTSHTHFGKALAENLFRAAIEAQDEDALKFLLTIPSIDVNSAICNVNGQKYTPIERAASLHDLGIVQLLLKAKADVNKTYQSNSWEIGALGRLIGSINRFSKFKSVTTTTTNISKILLDSGAKVDLAVAKRAFELPNSQPLAYLLITRVSDSDHASFIREGFVSGIAIELDDLQGVQAAKHLIVACERTRCRNCKKDYEEDLDWALIQAARCRRLELVKLLLLYSGSKTPHRAITAAFRSGNPDMIECILSLEPDLIAPAHTIVGNGWSWDRSYEDKPYTTSYAEAIRAKNEQYILEIERKGTLQLICDGGRFEHAITAASEIGDVVRVQKLLDICPFPTPSHLTSALKCSIEEDREDIFNILLAAGADVNQGSLPSLFLAVARRNSSMVRAILEADFQSEDYWSHFIYKDEATTIIELAFEWGNPEIIEDLIFAFPAASRGYQNLQTIHDSVDTAQLLSYIDRGLFDINTINRFLKIGLNEGNTELVDQLIARGADPSNEYVLATCLAKCPKLIREYMSSRKANHVIPGFGTEVLIEAIRSGQAGLATVNALLEMGCVDTKSFSESGKQTPLGKAIKAVQRGHYTDLEVIKSLLNRGCDPNSIVFHDTDLKPNVKHTALLQAIQSGSKGLVEILIQNGADVNLDTKIGLKRTPLQQAVEVNSLDIVNLLLDKEANPNAKPAQRGGATAFQLAAIRGNCTIAARLLESGADPDAPPAPINGRWPLEGAAENGRIEMIYFLWNLNRCCFDDKICQKAMKLAEENGYMACKGAIEELSRQMVGDMITAGQF